MKLLVITGLVVAMVATHSQDRGHFAMAANPEELAEDVAATLAELERVAAGAAWATYRPVPRSRPNLVADVHLWFREKLQVLNTLVDDETARKIAKCPDAGIKPNLIEIAREYSRNPEHLGRIVTHYVQHRGEEPVQAFPVDLATEEYRLAWELLLLSPASASIGRLRSEFFQAVSMIQNDESIPVLLWLCEQAGRVIEARASYVPFGGDPWVAEQFNVVQTLGRYRSPAALRAMLRCVEMAEAVKRIVPKKDGRCIKEWAVHMLRDHDAENGKPWREVIDETLQEKNALSDADRAFLQDVLKAPAER